MFCDVKVCGVFVFLLFLFVGWVFLFLVVFVVYVFVVIRMYFGYDRIMFGSGVFKIVMCGLWFVLVVLLVLFCENLKCFL